MCAHILMPIENVCVWARLCRTAQNLVELRHSETWWATGSLVPATAIYCISIIWCGMLYPSVAPCPRLPIVRQGHIMVKYGHSGVIALVWDRRWA